MSKQKKKKKKNARAIPVIKTERPFEMMEWPSSRRHNHDTATWAGISAAIDDLAEQQGDCLIWTGTVAGTRQHPSPVLWTSLFQKQVGLRRLQWLIHRVRVTDDSTSDDLIVPPRLYTACRNPLCVAPGHLISVRPSQLTPDQIRVIGVDPSNTPRVQRCSLGHTLPDYGGFQTAEDCRVCAIERAAKEHHKLFMEGRRAGWESYVRFKYREPNLDAWNEASIPDEMRAVIPFNAAETPAPVDG